jgi:osmotically-inducible protein OsmY
MNLFDNLISSSMTRLLCVLVLVCLVFPGCISNLWTGANLVYDRHDVYQKFGNYQLLSVANNELYPDKIFRCDRCNLDVAAFNDDLLVTGHLPTEELMQELKARLRRVDGYRHLYIEVVQSQETVNRIEDAWITTKIRSQVFADSSIEPNAFKVVTTDSIVYLLGDVLATDGRKIVAIARQTNGVTRVVKLLNYLVPEK